MRVIVSVGFASEKTIWGSRNGIVDGRATASGGGGGAAGAFGLAAAVGTAVLGGVGGRRRWGGDPSVGLADLCVSGHSLRGNRRRADWCGSWDGNGLSRPGRAWQGRDHPCHSSARHYFAHRLRKFEGRHRTVGRPWRGGHAHRRRVAGKYPNVAL